VRARGFLALSFLAAWALGLQLVAPGLMAGDSPELAASAYGWGISHPPGYPLWTLLAHLAGSIPLGCPAFRTNLVSLFPTALATAALGFLLARRTGGGALGEWVGYGTAFFIGTGPLFLDQATGTEVYGLHGLILTGLLALTLEISSERFYAVMFLVGLGVAHHHLLLLFLPAIGWAYRDFLRRPSFLLRGMSLVGLGLSLYLLLPIRALAHPAADWSRPDTWTQFWSHVSRNQYGGDLQSGAFLHALWNALFFWKDILRDGWFLAGILASWGIWTRRKAWRGEIPIALGLAGLGLGLPLLLRVHPDPQNNSVMEAFFPPMMIWGSPWVAVGLQGLSARMSRPWVRTVGALLLTGLLAARVGSALFVSSQSRNLACEDMGRNFLLNLPRGAALYSEGDTATFPLAYLKQVMGLRPDAEVFDRTGGLFGDFYGLLDVGGTGSEDPTVMVRKERGRESSHPSQSIFYSEKETAPGRTLAPAGFLFQATDSGAPSWDESKFWPRAREPRAGLAQDFLSRETGARFYVFRALAGLRGKAPLGKIRDDFAGTARLAWDNTRVLNNVGMETLRAGWVDGSLPYFEGAVEQDPDFTLGWYNQGIVARQQGRTRDAVQFFQRALQADPAYSPARDSWAILLYNNGHPPEAVDQWQRLLELDPSYAPGYRNLGFALATQDVTMSKQLLARYLQINPGAPERAQVEALLNH